MGALTGNIWVCAECRSINNERAKQCYNCRTPRELAAVDPSTIEGTGHGKLREIPLPRFESPRPYAVIASIAILATAGMQVIYTLDFTSLVLQTLDGTPADVAQLSFIALIGLVTLAIGIVGLVTWSLWLSSAVASMPALGLGYPAATRLTAFVENFLPGLNLLRVPAIVRDVVRRLESGSTAGQARGEALIFAAWIGLLGGFVVPRVFGFVNGLSAESDEAALRTQLTIQGVSIGLVLVGAIFLVALIWWIEERIARRREAQLAAIDAATAGGTVEVADASEDGVAIPEPMLATPEPTRAMPEPLPATPEPMPATPRIPAAPPATVRWSWGDSGDSPLAASTRTAPTTIPGSAAGWDTELLPPLARSSLAKPPAPTPTEPDVAVASEPVAETRPTPLPAPDVITAPQPTPEPPAQPPPSEPTSPVATAASSNGGPHVTIRIGSHGMLEAEMGGESEPVILEDLTAYGQALANAGGTAKIVVAGGDGMAPLLARRAQQILSEAGIEAPLQG